MAQNFPAAVEDIHVPLAKDNLQATQIPNQNVKKTYICWHSNSKQFSNCRGHS